MSPCLEATTTYPWLTMFRFQLGIEHATRSDPLQSTLGLASGAIEWPVDPELALQLTAEAATCSCANAMTGTLAMFELFYTSISSLY